MLSVLVGNLQPKKKFDKRHLNASCVKCCVEWMAERETKEEDSFFFHITAEMRSIMQNESRVQKAKAEQVK
jgi:ribulose 1,5-bisphosphate carboxylase large subunit-like protein